MSSRRFFGVGFVILVVAVLALGACSGDLLRYRTKMWHQCQSEVKGQQAKRVALERLLAVRARSLEMLRRDGRRLRTILSGKEAMVGQLRARVSRDATMIATLNRQKDAMAARTRLFRRLALKLRAMIQAGSLNVTVRKGRMIVNMANKILFDPGRAKLKQAGKEALQKLAAVLREIPDRDFVVAGHTDNRPVKHSRYRSNWSLSAARAVEVVAFLEKAGVLPRHLSAAGFSSFDPVGDNATVEGRAANRRIEIIVMPKISELPPIGPLTSPSGSARPAPRVNGAAARSTSVRPRPRGSRVAARSSSTRPGPRANGAAARKPSPRP
ncbi:MAG: OmpA family protein [Deltaproteobacteria bacterium]|nr:OmpA family protein [Deltaproteobacteria bacterium]